MNGIASWVSVGTEAKLSRMGLSSFKADEVKMRLLSAPTRDFGAPGNELKSLSKRVILMAEVSQVWPLQ